MQIIEFNNMEKTKRTIKMKWTFLITIFLYSLRPILACTGVVLVTPETVYYGGNEDYFQNFTPHMIISPGTNTGYGVIGLGWDGSFMQTGMNEKGLCFDGFATYKLVITKNKNKPEYAGNIVDRALRTCESVEEVMDLFDQYYLPWMESAQLMFADRFGNSVIYEGDDVLYKSGNYQVCTNFYQSIQQTPDERYNKALSLLENTTDYSFDLVKNILKETHVEGVIISHYSNIFDLKNGLIYIYKKYNYNEMMVIDFNEEIRKGTLVQKLESYFSITEIEAVDELPNSFTLAQNYPNPFNPTTNISFSLAKSSQVELRVYNCLGKLVDTLVNDHLAVGTHTLEWNGKDTNGNSVVSGIYFCELKTEEDWRTIKMNLIK